MQKNPTPLRPLPLTAPSSSVHVGVAAPLTPTDSPGGGSGPRPQSPYVGLTADYNPTYGGGRSAASALTAASTAPGVQRRGTPTADLYSTLFPLNNVHRNALDALRPGNIGDGDPSGAGDQRYSSVDDYRKSSGDTQPEDTQRAQILPRDTHPRADTSSLSSLVSSTSTSPLPPYHALSSSSSAPSSSFSSSQHPQRKAMEEQNEHTPASLCSCVGFVVPNGTMTTANSGGNVYGDAARGGGESTPMDNYASERSALSSFLRRDNGFESLPRSGSDSITPQDTPMDFGVSKPLSLAVDPVALGGRSVLSSAGDGSSTNKFGGGGGPTEDGDVHVDMDTDAMAVVKKRKKKPYKELTLEEKVELIRLAERNSSLSQASIAERYSIAKSNVCRILQRRAEYLRAYESAGFAGSRKRKLRGGVGVSAPSAPLTETKSIGGVGERASTTANASSTTQFTDRTSLSSNATINATVASPRSPLLLAADDGGAVVVDDDDNDKLAHFQKTHSRYNESVRIHMYKQHQVSRTFTCRCCNFAFADKAALRAHLQTKLEAKALCGARSAKSTFASFLETARKATSTFDDGVHDSFGGVVVEQPSKMPPQSNFVPAPPSAASVGADASLDGLQCSSFSSSSSSSSSVALLRALLLANSGVSHEDGIADEYASVRLPPVSYALDCYSNGILQTKPRLWKSCVDAESFQSYRQQQRSSASPSGDPPSFAFATAQPSDCADHMRYGRASAAAATGEHPLGAMSAASTLLMMHATAMRTALHFNSYAAPNFAANAAATAGFAGTAAEPTQTGLLSVWQSLIQAQQSGVPPPPGHANAMSTEAVGGVPPPDFGAFTPSAFRSVGSAGPLYSVLSEPPKPCGVIVEAVAAKSAERHTTPPIAETKHFAVNDGGVEEEFVGQQDPFGRDFILDLSKTRKQPNVDHADPRHSPCHERHHHQIVVDPCELSGGSTSGGSPSSSSTSHHTHHSSTSSSSTISPVIVVVNGAVGGDVDASHSFQRDATHNRADYGHKFVADGRHAAKKRGGDDGGVCDNGDGKSSGVGGSSGDEVSTFMALMGRCNHLEVCNVSLQNEMLRVQRCAQKLEGELERLRDRANLLQFKLLECREKALFVMQFQRKSAARGADEPNNNSVDADFVDDESMMMTRLYERMSDFVGDILRITLVK